MAIGLFYTGNPLWSFTRSYLVGFNIRANVTGLSINSSQITFYDPPTNQDVVLALRDNFYAWSSNHWQLNHVIDGTNSFFYIAGVPQVAGIIIGHGYFLNETNYRILIDINLAPVSGVIIDLPAAPGSYWRQPTPDT